MVRRKCRLPISGVQEGAGRCDETPARFSGRYGELGLGEFGTATLVDIVGQRMMAPTENFKKTFFPEAHAYSGPTLKKEFGFRKHGCVICPIQCKKETTCGRPLPEYESLSHFGALNANSNVESIMRANVLCNNYGMDTISAAATFAAYGEARVRS